jgi:hypothetical protein
MVQVLPIMFVLLKQKLNLFKLDIDIFQVSQNKPN